ncbi:MAG TPA: signal peptide peptidase SppA [Stenomitos sp.]
MRCRRFAVLLAPFFALPAQAAVPTDMGVIPSVAVSDDATALILNPAGLGAGPGGTTMLTREGWSTGTTRLLLNAGSLGLGYTNSNAGASFNDYCLGLGFALSDAWRWGMTYHLPAEGRPWTYDLGVMARPFNYLALGAAVRNAFAVPGGFGSSGREYQLGAAFRPFGPRWTLNLDVPYNDAAPFAWTTLQPFVGLDAEVIDGLHLRGWASTSGAFQVGLAVHSFQLGAGVMGTADRAGGYLRLSAVRERSVIGAKGTQWAKLDLNESLAAGQAGGLIGPTREVPPVYAALEAISDAQRDPQVGAMILKLGPTSAGWATLEEVRGALERFRSTGKPVVAYFEDGDFRSYYVATAADRVFVNPLGTLDFAGISHTYTYFKGLLANLGVEPQFISMGRFKTAMEPYERTDPSPAQREQGQAMIDDQFNRVVGAVSAARKLPADKVRALIAQGRFMAPEAQAAGLVDELAHRDEVPKRLEQVLDRKLSSVDALKLRYRTDAWAPPKVAVVNAAGGIAEGRSGSSLLEGPQLGSETIVDALRDVREDGAVKAVVFRVDSPGGSAMASEVMRRELALVAAKKPVVVSMGDVAASGGYWVSMIPNTPVYADPGTITGSIGVIVGKFNINGLLTKWGITNTTLKQGAHADMDSSLRAYTPDEEAMLRSSGEFYYGRFISLVAAQRSLSEGRVRELASGRVYTGAMAQGLGLVDKLAGLDEAIAEARRRAGLADQEIKLAFYPEANPLGALLSAENGGLRLRTELSITQELREAMTRLEPWGQNRIWLLPVQEGK